MAKIIDTNKYLKNNYIKLLIKTVASSTAIETGENVSSIIKKLLKTKEE